MTETTPKTPTTPRKRRAVRHRKRKPRSGQGNRPTQSGGQGGNAAASGATPATPGRNRLRRNVGLVIINADGHVLAGLRGHANGDKAWQLPQGGIEGRERPLAAAYRELKEETGLDRKDVELIGERRNWLDYWLPQDWMRRRFAGQTQKWFAFRYLGEGVPDLRRALDKEFEQLDWLEPSWLQAHVIDFRQKVYAEIFTEFARFLKPVQPE